MRSTAVAAGRQGGGAVRCDASSCYSLAGPARRGGLLAQAPQAPQAQARRQHHWPWEGGRCKGRSGGSG